MRENSGLAAVVIASSIMFTVITSTAGVRGQASQVPDESPVDVHSLVLQYAGPENTGPDFIRGKREGELEWPAIAHLKGVARVRYRILEHRPSMLDSYLIEFVLLDGSSVAVAELNDLAEFVDWSSLVSDKNAAVAVANLAVGIRQVGRAVEYVAIHDWFAEIESGRFESAFYGCAQLTPQGLEELNNQAQDRLLHTTVVVNTSGPEVGIVVRFPCVFWDLQSSIRLEEVRLEPSHIGVSSERVGFRLEDGRLVEDSGVYTSR